MGAGTRKPMDQRKFSPEDFYARIKILMAHEGLERDSEFEEKIGMRGALYRWKKGKDEPQPASLLKIKEVFQTSIDWLLTGKANDDEKVADFLPHYKSQTPVPVDTEKICQIVKIMEDYLQKVGLKISSDRKGKLLSLGYEYWITEPPPDETVIKKLLPLTI